ncbi:hypothetical protein OIU76_015172 [Salix suchowensis]|nr:hypothetical protein OIU76_015172 [Salix suchowensis]
MSGACGGGGGGASSMKDDGWGDRLRRTRIFFYSTVDAPPPPPPPPPLLAIKPALGREIHGKKMEGVYQKLRNLDAYPKINEDFYSRTLSDGLITLISSTHAFPLLL